jgi:hypothetical protein
MGFSLQCKPVKRFNWREMKTIDHRGHPQRKMEEAIRLGTVKRYL